MSREWWDRLPSHLRWLCGLSLVVVVVVGGTSEIPEVVPFGYEVGQIVGPLAFALLTGVIFHVLVVQAPQRKVRASVEQRCVQPIVRSAADMRGGLAKITRKEAPSSCPGLFDDVEAWWDAWLDLLGEVARRFDQPLVNPFAEPNVKHSTGDPFDRVNTLREFLESEFTRAVELCQEVEWALQHLDPDDVDALTEVRSVSERCLAVMRPRGPRRTDQVAVTLPLQKWLCAIETMANLWPVDRQEPSG